MRKLLRLIKNFLICLKTGSKPLHIGVSQIVYEKMFENKHILVTGGTSGIGLEIAKKFLSLGAKVTITGRNIDKLNAIRNEISNSNLTIVEWDISDSKVTDEKVNETVMKMGKIDILINNSGIYAPNSLFDTDEKLFDEIMNTNLKGLFFTSKKISEYFIKNTIKGKIINISSVRSIQGGAEPYGISKWGVRGLTQGLARDLIKNGIVVNAVAPGITASGINGINIENNAYTSSSLDNRVATPQEIAEIVIFLSSNASNHIIGQTIVCDGGETLI
ncbi:SDR family oxidoreductase [Aliarcobacter cryaerophilus]|uniref:SDR family NAD(P)-dependent oxidoreductase n=1 Tax=Aliarcobacter cryaerophilus TaxID=28198 RepID=UPI0021B246D1|nr:SDR family NAD(P)-dependent oxidoreductase [Aliarcobacter cryaerophilus]MCT7523342.1 SDR family oxidoreductase [Aliarcobacter cryaerophilus]